MGEGEGEGSSGNSRGLRNVAIPVPNAAIDQYANEFNAIVEDTDPNQKYSSLSTQIKYHEIEFDHSTQKYKLKNAPNVDPENQTINGFSLDFINEMKNLCNLKNKGVYPDFIQAAMGSANKNTLLTNAINHDKWKDNTLPVFDINKSYFSNETYTINNLDVEAPETFFNFFWPDEYIEVIVKETNKYIDLKHKRKMQQNIQSKKTQHTTLEEVKLFMGCVLYMSTYRLPNPRLYWVENQTKITDNFTLNRFEELRANLHFNGDDLDETYTVKSGKKALKLIDMINARLSLLEMPDENLCVDEMMVPSKSKFGPRVYQKGKPHPWGFKIYSMSIN